MDIQNNKIPEFAIFQNSRTKVSGVWTRAGGEWVEASRSEYEILALLSKLLRTSPEPAKVLRLIAKENPNWGGGMLGE